MTPELIREHNLPGFNVDTKAKDSRYRWYKTSQGARAWELDALNPNVLRAVVEEAIRGYRGVSMNGTENWDSA